MPKSLSLKFVKTAKVAPRGPVVFAVVRDEIYFLPHFFDHYRSIGVDGFLIYDDRSREPTREFLHAQPDCSVICSDHSFGDTFGRTARGYDRRLPMALKESVPETLLQGRWVLTVDADEFLVLPRAARDLPALIERLARIDQPYLTAPMVDFYGPTLAHRNYPRHLGPFEGNPYFDAGPYFTWTDHQAPAPLGGGLRFKLLRMFLQQHPEAAAAVFHDQAPSPAMCWKTPLLRQGRGVVRLGDHELNIAPRADVTAALAHFKFYPDLDTKIDVALAEGQYYNGSVEYRFLKAAIDLMPDVDLVTWETRRYDGPVSLEQAQLIRPLA